MARTESLEALGRDYAINFGSQSVSSNREQPADPYLLPEPPGFAAWFADRLRPADRFESLEAYRAGMYEATQATPKAEPPADLPPLPEPAFTSFQCDSTMRYTELRSYSGTQMSDYARAARKARHE